ncbi:CPBP family intramembrane metalloprotease [Pseudoduganella eburnea]|uniref:CPBP family intramembrane metalloprotease n=1 Tax=Massilia eburnea TaxID=1776165 RepID=A0A6L6QAS6_9BURK|nr:CPBP family intramembrane glutamic endopeptidase [Massilia eburnea]MTW09532.1 CPBP family intramembrane metalloprotease [Massilia eburnea]
MQAISALACLPFGFLGLSIATAGLAAAPHIQRPPSLRHLWLVLLGLAVSAGLAAGVVHPSAGASIAALLAFAWLATSHGNAVVRACFTVLALLLAFGLALHAVPGFDNPLLLKDVRLSPDSAPYTMYANFDKGVAGLVLLVFFCRRASTWRDFASAWRSQAPLSAALVCGVLGAGWAIGLVHPDFKLSPFLPMFAVVNLLFVCVAEEAFFRGVIQGQLARFGETMAATVSGLLFGAAHLGGGWQFAALASLAGLGYALLYSRTRRIEIPIATHFLLNLAHFIVFTYPRSA